MGFFDKIRETIQDAREAIQGASSKYDPEASAKELLADETVKKYFEAICDMEWVVNDPISHKQTEITKNYEYVKKYFEHFFGNINETEKFQTAYGIYMRSKNITTKIGSNDWLLECAISELISSRQKELEESLEKDDEFKSFNSIRKIRGAKRLEAYRVIFSEDIAAATIDYNKILDVIKNNVNHKHYSQGLQKLTFKNDIINNSSHLKHDIKDIVIADSFLNGNDITREMVFLGTEERMLWEMNDERADYACNISMLILKALHFEEYGSTGREGYTPLRNDEIRNYVLTVDYFKNKINDHPFDIEEYTREAIKRVKDSNVVSLHDSDDYYCDTVCNMMWKKITKGRNWTKDGENISDSRDLNDIFDIICTYFQQKNNSL